VGSLRPPWRSLSMRMDTARRPNPRPRHPLTTQTVLILKYIIPDYTGYIYYGGANVGMNGGIMISWVARAHKRHALTQSVQRHGALGLAERERRVRVSAHGLS
jgi:hypothetical protein